MNSDFIVPSGKSKLNLLWSAGTPGTKPPSNTVNLDLSKYQFILIEHYDNSEKTPLNTASFQLCRVGCSAVLFKIGHTNGNVCKLPVDVYTDHVFFDEDSATNAYYYTCPNKIYGVNI